MNSVVAPFAEREPLELLAEERRRAVCFGEALNAICEYVGEDMVSPPDVAILRRLEVAYRKMNKVWDDFAPQDFALYAMSLLPAHLENEDALRRLREGAAQYLLDQKSKIAPEIQNLSSTAQALLKSKQATPKPDWGFPDIALKPVTPAPETSDVSELQNARSEPTVSSPVEAPADHNIYRRPAKRHKRKPFQVVPKDPKPDVPMPAEEATLVLRDPVTPGQSERGVALLIAGLGVGLAGLLILIALFFMDIPQP